MLMERLGDVDLLDMNRKLFRGLSIGNGDKYYSVPCFELSSFK